MFRLLGDVRQLNSFKWGDVGYGTPGGTVTWAMAGTEQYQFRAQYEQPLASFYPRAEVLIRAAFEEWANVANINFVQLSNGAEADIRFGGVESETWQATAIPQLGPDFLENYADLLFDPTPAFAPWSDWGAADESSWSFYGIAIHEIGHALGLDHPDFPDILNNPEPAPNDPAHGEWQDAYDLYYSSIMITGIPNALNLDDINGMRFLYGGVYRGDGAADVLDGGAGYDIIHGGGGDDLIRGGGGGDVVYGNQDNDLIYGNQGADVLYGGQGDDVLYGGQHADVIYGNLQNDVIYGNFQDDVLWGGQGDDVLYGGQDQDILHGNLGNDVLYGNRGNDILYGGHGQNTLIGGPGADTFYVDGDDVVLDLSAEDAVFLI